MFDKVIIYFLDKDSIYEAFARILSQILSQGILHPIPHILVNVDVSNVAAAYPEMELDIPDLKIGLVWNYKDFIEINGSV